jgi:hypothetical protein
MITKSDWGALKLIRDVREQTDGLRLSAACDSRMCPKEAKAKGSKSHGQPMYKKFAETHVASMMNYDGLRAPTMN